MDLSTATSPQHQIITTLDAPLSVAAGAGSGKTFTLTNRIGHALVGAQGQAPFISSIDEVLAITFTRTGAAEMKSRIASLLQEEGLDEQARKVEDAWIMTIHGMCARILREHALEIGIDPGFDVIEDVEAKELWARALEATLQTLKNESSDPRLEALIDRFPVTSFSYEESLSDLVTNVWEKTFGMPDGFESVILPPQGMLSDLSKPLRSMIEIGEQYRAVAQGWSKTTKPDRDHLAALEDALTGAEEYLEHAELSGASFADPGFNIDEYLQVFFTFPKTSAKYRAKKEDADFFAHYRAVYADLANRVVLEAMAVTSSTLLRLVRMVNDEYQLLKGPERLDNVDLLRLTDRALAEDEAMRKSYQQRFKLIMVDEFQDTDLMQVSIIDSLSIDHGANVMTVGDAQQGIYGFRGADVEVFFSHQENQCEKHKSLQVLSLPDNFRSHADVLAFVDMVFSRDDLFGERFLSLNPMGEVNDDVDPIFASEPRVEVNVFEWRKRGGSAYDARTKSARAIADRFARLRGAGAHPGDMVILLGTMSNADVYVRALREEGFECVMTGGSIFTSSPEVATIAALLRCVADHTNSTSLYDVLASPLFDLSDDALFMIGSHKFDIDDAELASRSFARRFWRMAHIFAREGEDKLRTLYAGLLSSDDVAEIVRAIEVLMRFDRSAQEHAPAEGLQQVLLESGWLYRLQEAGASGQAAAANLFKAIDMVWDRQNEGQSLICIADGFTAFLEASKEAPGVLNSNNADFVRIMTIHASKGLEFPHVAVSDVPSGKTKNSKLLVDNISDQVLLTFQPSLDDSASRVFKELSANLPEIDLDTLMDGSLGDLEPYQYSSLLKHLVATKSLDAAKRLLYVALTRASKSLCFCMAFEGSKEFDYSNKGIYGMLADTFAWESDPALKHLSFEYGGSAPAQITHEVLIEASDRNEDDHTPQEGFLIVERAPVSLVPLKMGTARHNVVSYSSLSPDHERIDDSISYSAYVIDDQANDDEHVIDLDEEMFDDIATAIKQQHAVQLGTAFHRLAQRAIESRLEFGIVPLLSPEVIEKQIISCDLTPDQAERLQSCLDRWFESDLCMRFFGHERIFAEVPFMLDIDAGEHLIFLEGEIDGLAFDEQRDAKRALFIDYKTGGSDDETEDLLHHKHLLQAQCYALALMREGIEVVEACFVRVEQRDPDYPSQPQVVRYSFTSGDQDELEATVIAAYEAREAREG